MKILNWIKLSACVFGLWLLMFVVAPSIQQWDSVKPIHQFVEQENIDAGALYYTDSEEFSDAEKRIRDSLRYGAHH